MNGRFEQFQISFSSHISSCAKKCEERTTNAADRSVRRLSAKKILGFGSRVGDVHERGGADVGWKGTFRIPHKSIAFTLGDQLRRLCQLIRVYRTDSRQQNRREPLQGQADNSRSARRAGCDTINETPREEKMKMDATKKITGEGFKHPWLPLIRMDENMRKKMDALFGGTR